MNDVTLCIKTFNRLGYLDRLMASIRAVYPEVPVIIVNDGVAIAPARYAGPTRLIQLPAEVGLSRGRNIAVDAVTTPLMVLLDDDFVFNAHTNLARWAELLQKHSLDICGALLTKHGEHTHFEGNLVVEDSMLSINTVELHEYPECMTCELVWNFFMARTDRIKALRWDDDLRVATEHVDFFLRAKAAHLRVGYCHEISAEHLNDTYSAPYKKSRKRGTAGFAVAMMRKHGVTKLKNAKGYVYSIDDFRARQVAEQKDRAATFPEFARWKHRLNAQGSPVVRPRPAPATGTA